MGKLAFLFAGQGAQKPGMGQSLCQVPAAAWVFDMAEAMRPGTKADCFEGTPERLAQTEVTQPCVFTVDLATACALAERGITPDGVAGFSLGELAALAFAQAFTPEDAFELVCRRALLMQQAAQDKPGAMAAVMRLPNETVEELCAAHSQLYPVNYNGGGQLVVAGSADELPAFCDAVKATGGMAKPLPVSGAFHCPYMAGAAASFVSVLQDTDMQPPGLPVYANLTGRPYTQPVRDTLAEQMKNPVRWEQTILNMAADGYDRFVEVGPGKTLSGLVKRILPGATLASVQDIDSLDAAVEIMRQAG